MGSEMCIRDRVHSSWTTTAQLPRTTGSEGPRPHREARGRGTSGKHGRSRSCARCRLRGSRQPQRAAAQSWLASRPQPAARTGSLATGYQQRRCRPVDAAHPRRCIFEKCIFEKCIFEKCIFRKFCKFLAGSFSAVSKRMFARKHAFDSIFQDLLQDVHTFAPLQTQHLLTKMSENSEIFVLQNYS